MKSGNLDRELVEFLDRIAARDDDAFKALYDRTSSKLYGLALRIVRSREQAEDVLQDAFLVVWRSAESYRESLSPPMAWLGLIVRSKSLDALRKKASDRADVTQELDETVAVSLEGSEPNPMDAAQASEQAFALHQCLTRLDHKQRAVVSLAYLRDHSHSELAEQLMMPLGTVKTYIRRGIDQLRTCMARYL